MAFSYANVASDAAAIGGSSAGVQIRDGRELKEIQTGQLGFKTINGETKIRLLPSPWPSEDPPIPSAQLLSVASSQGILAAAGPEGLIIASTDGVRETLSAREGENVRDIKPILTIPHDRLTHVAFSSDESVLVVSGPSTSGIVVYKADQLKAGEDEAALQIHMQSSLRALVPNPNPRTTHLFALVDNNGDLFIADLSTGQLVKGSDGTSLHNHIICVTWSKQGKRLAAGTASGTIVQLKLDGTVEMNIPKSTSIPDDSHVSAISWLENDTFFIIYTPNSTSAEDGIPPSEYCIVERSNNTNLTFHKLPEILPPFGMERLPTYHFIARLRKFDPHLTDLLLLAATTATEIGIISKSSQPLSTSDDPDLLVANEFTAVILEDDTKRAALPLSAETALDTSAIGMAVDLSSKEPVINPLPSDPEIQETIGPVPNLLVLNNEGLLCSWWIIYADSIKQKTTFSGFDSLKATEELRSAVSPPAQTEEPRSPEPMSSFKQPASSAASPFAKPTTSTSSSGFGSFPTQSNFGIPKLQHSSSTFGSGTSFSTASKIGEEKSSWTSTGFNNASNSTAPGSTFGQTGFGQPTFGNAATFGTAGFANRTPGFGQPAAPAFGQTGFGSDSTTSAFRMSGNGGANSGFASFATAGGFGAGSDKKEAQQNPFGKQTLSGGFASFAGPGGFGTPTDKKDTNTASPFGKATSGGFGAFAQGSNTQSPFGNATGSGSFGQPSTTTPFANSQAFRQSGSATNGAAKSPFGSGKPFKLESSFKGDGTAKDDLSAPTGDSKFGLDSTFGNLLGETKKEVTPAEDKETEMDEGEDREIASTSEDKQPFAGFSPEQKNEQDGVSKNFITPPSTISQPKPTQTPSVSSLFGPPQQQQTTTPQQAFTGFQFASTTPKETPTAARTIFGTKSITESTPAAVQKSEPVNAFSAIESPQKASVKEELENPKASNILKKQIGLPVSESNVDTESIPHAPLPPDPVSKPGYTTGDTSASSTRSKESKGAEVPEEAPLSPDFLPANKSASQDAEAAELPEDEHDTDDEDFSSGFDDSGEDVTQDVSTAEEVEDDRDEEATTDHIQSSPESSFKGGDTTSPTGGLFTKVTPNEPLKPSRSLFGEVGRSAPIFAPPKPQQSPRSPSPVRPFVAHDSLRPDNRSVSAPIRPRSAIDQRKTDYSQSAIAAQAAKAREEEVAREQARLEALKSASEKAKKDELQMLEDDEDERIQRELALPIQPSKILDEFITYQASQNIDSHKADIPAQIERLYQDINSMICTLGINARSLSAFMLYQKTQPAISKWPAVLQSEAPMDALGDAWSLNDIQYLPEGITNLGNSLESIQIEAVPQKLESCQTLLTKDLFDLRTKLTAIRKSLHTRSRGVSSTAPLSAEQAAIQHDLRKASAAVQTNLVQVEDTLALIRARLVEVVPQGDVDRAAGGHAVQKKPTVEAVTNTIAKMTSMAEKKSADIDVLEAQLKKLDVSFDNATSDAGQHGNFFTPRRNRAGHTSGTPESATSSVFYTPDSKAGFSARSTRSHNGNVITSATVSAEDKERWETKARRKRDVAAALRAILEDKRNKNLASG